MANTLPEVVTEEFLCCPLCLRPYSFPKILPCLHSYCRQCLQHYINKNEYKGLFPCPTCFTETKLPDQGLAGLQSNTFLTNLQDMALSQMVSDNTCNNCESSKAVYRCLDCRHYLCSGCCNAHNWLKVTKRHKVLTLKELQSGRHYKELKRKQTINCSIHSNQILQYCCAECDDIICIMCKGEGHAGHRMSDIERSAKRERAYLNSLSEAILNQTVQFQKALTQLDKYKTQCDLFKLAITESIKFQKEKLLKIIDDAAKEHIRQVESNYNRELTKADMVKKQVNRNLLLMQNTYQLLKNVIRQARDEDVLKLKQPIKMQCEFLITLTPNEIQSKLGMQFTPTTVTMDDILQLIGQLVTKETTVQSQKRRQLQSQIEEQKNWTFTPELLYMFKAETIHDKKGCRPTGLVINKHDEIVLVDDINKKLKVFDQTGELKHEICPTGEHELVDPWDIAILIDQNYAVTDRGAKHVKVFNSEGKFIKKFGENHLKSPWGITTNHKGEIIVADFVQKDIFVHDTEGNLLFNINKKGDKDVLQGPEYVAVNTNGDIIVSDCVKHHVIVYDCDGRFIYKYGGRGNAVSEFEVPCGVATDTDGNILVVDYDNKRLHMLNAQGKFRCFTATKQDGLHIPQALAVNNKCHLVVIDGSMIKIFDYPQSDEQGNMEKALQQFNQAYEEWVRSPTSPAVNIPTRYTSKILDYASLQTDV